MNIRRTLPHLPSRSIAAIVSVALLSGITGRSLAQEPAIPSTEKAAAEAPAITLPVARQITDSAGRKMSVIILSKTADAIHIRRTSDGKEFDIPLTKLADDDRKFVAEANVKKPTLLLIGQNPNSTAQLIPTLKAEFNILHESYADANFKWPDIAKMTDEELKSFDVIWLQAHFQWLKFPVGRMLDAKRIVVCRDSRKVNCNVKAFLDGSAFRGTNYKDFDYEPYSRVDGTLVRYGDVTASYDPKTDNWPTKETHPEKVDEAIAEVKKLLAKAGK